ncbi:hypothetical protein SASPL_124622 [Salvia splendens]|uniref:ER lumen protein retaining receptor n=1 Tax=Salvia splendens TaxID=180675 RepID=A0A8X8XDU2_SALSN|nr:hypothetical protein SASPL_124622 [Salvia splendens]
MKAPRRPVQVVASWLRRQPPKVKAFLAVISGMAALVLLRAIVHDHDNLFVAAEAVHSIGIAVLIYKLMKEKTCAGISLKSQELTAIFLAVRLYCSLVMEYDIHTVLDLATLATTLWVVYMIRFNLKSSYMEDKDNIVLYYVIGGLFCRFSASHVTQLLVALKVILGSLHACCSTLIYAHINLFRASGLHFHILRVAFSFLCLTCYGAEEVHYLLAIVLGALLIHPSTTHHIINRIAWAFCVYLEAVSVLPQLRVMQNTKIVEPFTAHYVFALGVARFLSCAHWVLQVLDTRGHLLVALGYGLWPSLVLISEIVQTFILADFCYYYVKSVFGGQLVLRLPSGVV